MDVIQPSAPNLYPQLNGLVELNAEKFRLYKANIILAFLEGQAKHYEKVRKKYARARSILHKIAITTGSEIRNKNIIVKGLRKREKIYTKRRKAIFKENSLDKYLFLKRTRRDLICILNACLKYLSNALEKKLQTNSL